MSAISIRNPGAKTFKQDGSTFEQEQDANSALSDLDRGICFENISNVSIKYA